MSKAKNMPVFSPGDKITWEAVDRSGVHLDDTLWSSAQNRYVPIGSGLTHTVLSHEDDVLTWLNELGVHAITYGPTRQNNWMHSGRFAYPCLKSNKRRARS